LVCLTFYLKWGRGANDQEYW